MGSRHAGDNHSAEPHPLEAPCAIESAISPHVAGREGTNRTYCHPRKGDGERADRRAGRRQCGDHSCVSVGGDPQRRYDGRAVVDEPASDQLWVTARDGDVVLTTTGNGAFTRE